MHRLASAFSTRRSKAVFSPNQRATCYMFQISVPSNKLQKAENLILPFFRISFSTLATYFSLSRKTWNINENVHIRAFRISFVVHCDMLQLCKYNFPIEIFANEASKRSSTWLVISLAKKERLGEQRRRNRQKKKRRWISRGHSRLCKPHGSTRYLAVCRLSNNIIAQRQRKP